MLSTTGSLWLYRRLVALYASIKRFPVTLTEFLLSLYFSYWNLSPCIVDLDDCQTSMHVWAANQPRSNKSNLVLVHGYGGNSKWQFILQVAQLTCHFNVYIPDLVFFGKSFSTSKERTDTFQAECVCNVMKKLGVEKYSVYGISYGGFVVYRMAEMEEKSIEKVVIVSSGIVFTEDQKRELLKKIGMNVVDVLVPEKPEEIKTLCRLSMYKIDVAKWLPDFFLRGFIAEDSCKKEKQELVEYLLLEKPDLHFPVLNQMDSECIEIDPQKDSSKNVDMQSDEVESEDMEGGGKRKRGSKNSSKNVEALICTKDWLYADSCSNEIDIDQLTEDIMSLDVSAAESDASNSVNISDLLKV